jgi:ABC-type polysaccharide/polyol phosphate export permease
VTLVALIPLVEQGGSFVTDYLSGIWRLRNFWLSLVRIDLRRRYRGTIIGIGWSLLHPIAMTIVLCVVFSQIQHQNIRTYAPYLLTGLTFWGFLHAVVVEGCQCFFQGESYIRQQPAPLAIYPLRTTLSAGFHFLIGLLIVVVFVGGVHAINQPTETGRSTAVTAPPAAEIAMPERAKETMIETGRVFLRQAVQAVVGNGWALAHGFTQAIDTMRPAPLSATPSSKKATDPTPEATVIHSPVLAILSLLPTLMLLFVIGWSVAVCMGTLNVLFQDSRHLVEVGMQILFYLTPIIYPPTMLESGGRLARLMSLNPLASLLELLRAPLLDGRLPSLWSVGMASCFAMVTVSAAVIVLTRIEKRMIFYL